MDAGIENSGSDGPSRRTKTRLKQERKAKTLKEIRGNVRALAAVMQGKKPKLPCPEIKEWLVDTGSGHDLIDATTAGKFQKWIRESPKTYKLHTAGGIRNVNQEVPLYVSQLGDKAVGLILPSTPAVLSMGRRCVEEGYHFEWPPFSSSPFMIAPDGKMIRLFVRGYVPYIRKDSFTGEYVEFDRKTKLPVAPAEDVRRRSKKKDKPTEADKYRNIPDLVYGIASNDPRQMEKNQMVHVDESTVGNQGSDADEKLSRNTSPKGGSFSKKRRRPSGT